jgi:hypothetical protein
MLKSVKVKLHGIHDCRRFPDHMTSLRVIAASRPSAYAAAPVFYRQAGCPSRR